MIPSCSSYATSKRYTITIPQNNSPEVVDACMAHFRGTERLKAFNIDAQIVMAREYLKLGATVQFATKLTLWHFYGEYQRKYAATAIYDELFRGFNLTMLEKSYATTDWPGDVFLAAMDAVEAAAVKGVAA